MPVHHQEGSKERDGDTPHRALRSALAKEDEVNNRFHHWNQRIIDEFRANNGAVSRFGRGLLLVHHIGAKSDVARISPVISIRHDPDTWHIAASNGGAPENPGWYHNLLAKPETSIETADDGVVDVSVQRLERQERDAAWEQFKAVSPGFREYELNTSRTIPVLALHRRAT
jgi:deazaflavin-dependent oxidoreductase (nitroreductase family)